RRAGSWARGGGRASYDRLLRLAEQAGGDGVRSRRAEHDLAAKHALTSDDLGCGVQYDFTELEVIAHLRCVGKRDRITARHDPTARVGKRIAAQPLELMARTGVVRAARRECHDHAAANDQ